MSNATYTYTVEAPTLRKDPNRLIVRKNLARDGAVIGKFKKLNCLNYMSEHCHGICDKISCDRWLERTYDKPKFFVYKF